MKILFYLPVVTPWWFDNIVKSLIRAFATEAEVHVLAPAPWSNTGIGPRELRRCADLKSVQWHIADGAGHEGMRTEPADRAGIVAFVQALGPDYVFCRSADCDTVSEFPGKVRYLMEGGAPPFELPSRWIVLQHAPFDHGCRPDLEAAQRAELDALIAPAWNYLQTEHQANRQARKAFRDWAKIPAGRPVLALPLEYEHHENFFPIQRVGARPNASLVAEIAAAIDPRFFIAVTNHPLNTLHIDNGALEAEIAQYGDRMRLLPSETRMGENTTAVLARDADAMLVGNSKSYANCGFFGTPIMRRSRFKTGDWLNAYSEFETFLPAIAEGNAARPDTAQARTWFAFHIANNAIDPNDPELTGAELLRLIDMPVDPARWERGIARLRETMPEAYQ